MGAVVTPIASHLPGRLRLRDSTLRDAGRNRALSDAIAGWRGVAAADGNPRTGGILVRYDPAIVAPGEMEERARAALAPPRPAEPADEGGEAANGNGNGGGLRRANRVAKIGMLATMATMLAALAFSKRVHAAAGVLHVGLLMIHLARHRKGLLK